MIDCKQMFTTTTITIALAALVSARSIAIDSSVNSINLQGIYQA
jgi:hypothetical protein